MASNLKRIGLCSAILASSAFLANGSVMSQSSATGIRFGLFGDLAYTAAREPQFANVMADLDRHDLAFAVHVGDLGSPRSGS